MRGCLGFNQPTYPAKVPNYFGHEIREVIHVILAIKGRWPEEQVAVLFAAQLPVLRYMSLYDVEQA